MQLISVTMTESGMIRNYDCDCGGQFQPAAENGLDLVVRDRVILIERLLRLYDSLKRRTGHGLIMGSRKFVGFSVEDVGLTDAHAKSMPSQLGTERLARLCHWVEEYNSADPIDWDNDGYAACRVEHARARIGHVLGYCIDELADSIDKKELAPDPISDFGALEPSLLTPISVFDESGRPEPSDGPVY